MRVSFFSKGDWSKTFNFFKRNLNREAFAVLDSLGRQGVEALKQNTPKDSGVTADSWTYEIVSSNGQTSIQWTNDNVENGFPVAIMLQYGHGTGTGGYVQGRDYINPAIKPVFDNIAEAVWREVTK